MRRPPSSFGRSELTRLGGGDPSVTEEPGGGTDRALSAIMERWIHLSPFHVGQEHEAAPTMDLRLIIAMILVTWVSNTLQLLPSEVLQLPIIIVRPVEHEVRRQIDVVAHNVEKSSEYSLYLVCSFDLLTHLEAK